MIILANSCTISKNYVLLFPKIRTSDGNATKNRERKTVESVV